MHPDPLQAGEDGRQFVAALEWQANLFDGDDLEIGLSLEWVARGRMLRVERLVFHKKFNPAPTFAANP